MLEIEGWTARLLPSRQFGYIVLTTSAGIMDHEEARRKNVGGKFLGTFKIVVDTEKTYLLRVVNAVMSKTLYFGIARHNLTIVAMDGSRITKPFTTDYVELSMEQSVDCIFEANQQPDYYYMVAGTNVSQTHDTNKITTAIIEYQGNYIPSSSHLLPQLRKKFY
ncbi:hypothetical protein KY290_021914 [Solanum tuberosum]|uniref:Small ribosomal subunit protein uS8c n=1 Tax=Solanum tuberosum TaxID=4113 RepID=A0ABQ7V4W8_SOLTU|nr:hypothetical protein KY289_021076 [Solanum tuberosum]KAH0758421.1 hypothetical protein KY290_021914 [Solanum tuberosum]